MACLLEHGPAYKIINLLGIDLSLKISISLRSCRKTYEFIQTIKYFFDKTCVELVFKNENVSTVILGFP